MRQSGAGIFTDTEWAKLLEAMKMSPRQRQIVRCVFDGMSDQQIALQLGIAISTVRMHFTRLFAKYDLQSRHELVLLAVHHFRQECQDAGCPRRR